MVDTLYRHKTRFTDHTPFQFRWRITQLHSQYYDAYINALVTYETTGPDGRTYRQVDEDMKVEVQMKLLDAIQHHWREMI